VTRPSLVVALPLAAAGLLLTGCGTGLHSQVYEPRNQGDSVNVTDGSILVRNAFVTVPPNEDFYAEGDDAEFNLTVINRKAEDDALVSVTTPDAESTEVTDGPLEVGGFSATPVNSTVQLKGLTRRLAVADYVPLTLTFRSGATVTVDAPVAQAADVPPSPNPSFHVPETDSTGKVVHEGSEGAGGTEGSEGAGGTEGGSEH
jgi:copper(I)-binding protein